MTLLCKKAHMLYAKLFIGVDRLGGKGIFLFSRVVYFLNDKSTLACLHWGLKAGLLLRFT